MNRLIAVILVTVGTGLLLYPHLQEYYYASAEQRLINEFKQLDDSYSNYQREESLAVFNEDVLDIKREKISIDGERESPIEDSGEPAERELQNITVQNEEAEDIIGLIHIPEIDLSLPLLMGATDEHLNVGAGVLLNTTPLWEAGNTGIAAHRSHTYGRQFNRLEELSQGDLISVETKNGKDKYEVYQTKVVSPDDISVLEPDGDKHLITLITCTPMIDPTHRLIVHAEKK